MADENPSAGPPARPAIKRFARPLPILIDGVIVCIIAFAAAMGATVGLRYLTFSDPDIALAVLFGVFVIPVVLALLGLALVVTGAVRWAVHGSRGQGVPTYPDMALLDVLESINGRLLLSETAKRIAYRAEDIQALRQTIRKDIDRRDFDAALILVNEMSHSFGYREEAEAFRDQILSARNVEMESKISEGVSKLEDILARREFDKAAREVAKLQRLYPDSSRVHSQADRVAAARDRYKQDLERQFLAAAGRDDVDQAMDLLKELDKYLDENEAEPYRETARGVIGKKRDNLGVQFKLSVQDKEWHTAVRVGEQIIRDFPNTRMADEVRSMLDLVRQRASQEQAASGKM